MQRARSTSFHVYFSASSDVEKETRDRYTFIVETIKNIGGKVIANWLNDKVVLNPQGVFEQAITGIEQADIVVADITQPSIGVGQQIEYALSQKIPVIGVYYEGIANPSRFTLGSSQDSTLLTICKYTEDSLFSTLKQQFESISKSQFVKFNFICTKEINNYLDSESEKRQTSKSEFLREIIREKMKKSTFKRPIV